MINVMHDGTLGDIIYSLPFCRGLSELHKDLIQYYLRINSPTGINPSNRHPLPGIKLNAEYANNLLPLLRAQPYIHAADIFSTTDIHYDLNTFRHLRLDLALGDIKRWVRYNYPCVHLDTATPWLSVIPDTTYNDCVVINRSMRYRQPTVTINFEKLIHYKTVFVGLEDEYTTFRTMVPNCAYVKVNDYYQLATIIAGSKLFIGNQSFAYSIADGLKVKRCLEVCFNCPNCVVCDVNGYEFMNQETFETLCDYLLDNKQPIVNPHTAVMHPSPPKPPKIVKPSIRPFSRERARQRRR